MISGNGVVAFGLDNVDHVMADLAAFENRWLRGADVHPPIHLHRIDRDDLSS
jgi:hypothetical protein